MDRADVLKQIQRNVRILSEANAPEFQYIPLHQKPSPSVLRIQKVMSLLRSVIFPGFFDEEQTISLDSLPYYIGVYLEQIYDVLQEQIYDSLCFEAESCCSSARLRASDLAVSFLNQIPKLKYLLSTDVKAILDGDPAAKSLSEVIFCYPAIFAMLHQRVAHELFKLEIPVLPRMITEMAHSATGIDIHPGAQIGEYFSMDHGTGIVVGQTAIIGNHVRLYQGVTLGAKSFTLDDYVTIYSNASVLGRITIGRGSVIGGNIWLTHSVPPNTVLTQSRAQAK